MGKWLQFLNKRVRARFTSRMIERTGRMSWTDSTWFKTEESSSMYSIWFLSGRACLLPYMSSSKNIYKINSTVKWLPIYHSKFSIFIDESLTYIVMYNKTRKNQNRSSYWKLQTNKKTSILKICSALWGTKQGITILGMV